MNFEVKWTPEMMEYYKHGSTVEHLEGKQVVFFKNNMLSPGATLAKWISNPNYQGGRGFMQLPLLEKGKRYQVKLQAKASPKPEPLLKITFYNRVEEVIGIQIISKGKGHFTYPMRAYAYAIELLNHGIQELFFQSIVIASDSR
ncbi:accessory Sec system protein Asp3 [Lactococcus garvieae]|uniref:Accessory secretory protein Asp3 n=1 Tax=Lactococcus garvieae DCC43 TaxID=1231377 RepID=K2PND6_9LACT|nr:accessory Sec system protein Asp3 [Lactococcus garvieae]EKF51779.1 Accessory secretory protein Asp3 [Lactococcus garvieae DCC43]